MDIFVSYEHESSELVNNLVTILENHGRKCWYAPRDVLVSYASDIIDAISKCKIFLLILTERAMSSKHILNEIECAYKYFKTDQTTIIPFLTESCQLTGEMVYYIQRIQFINAYDIPFDDAVSQLENKISKLIGNVSPTLNVNNLNSSKPSQAITIAEDDEIRDTNRYYDTQDTFENRRLKTEAEILYPIESKVYDKILCGKENLNCLIVNTMYAPGVMNRLKRPEIKNIIGLCYNDKACMAANYEYENDHTKFFYQDVESKDFEDKLIGYMEERTLKGFDVIDITMGFLDWKNPFKVMRIISHYLNPDAVIYVRDIDDKVLYAYPDDKGLFKDFTKFYRLDPISGFRQSGRRIYSYLKKVGAKKVELHVKGVDTMNMDRKQMEKMFAAYFSFIPNDFNISLRKEPDNQSYKAVIDWCDKHYDELEESFMDEDFVFNSGYFIYTAQF